jgi:hypothetical protein
MNVAAEAMMTPRRNARTVRAIAERPPDGSLNLYSTDFGLSDVIGMILNVAGHKRLSAQ